MTAGRGGSELAELLEELKQRSGRSYAALAHRTGLGRSTVHRYCLGTTVPRTFGVVEKVARVCGADRAELDRLYRAWCQAIDAEDGAEDDAANDAEDGAAIDAANGADDAVDGAEAPSVPASPPASPASRAPSGAAMPLRGLQHHHRSLGAAWVRGQAEGVLLAARRRPRPRPRDPFRRRLRLLPRGGERRQTRRLSGAVRRRGPAGRQGPGLDRRPAAGARCLLRHEPRLRHR